MINLTATVNTQTMSKSTQLRQLIERDSLGFLMEAHNGLSAKIVEEAGFEAIWASGLSMSAAMGVRDSNEATWTQILEILEFMSDRTQIPILVDGDTGFGDFNTMRRLVRKLESRDIGGVCIEDKIFPKTNSFINGKAQPLASIPEFCGKIKAGKDTQKNDDFVIVARVEAFIAGWGLEEALKRASAYHEAGADAILMHSSLRDPSEIFAFAKAWDQRCPVVIVPTKYYSTPTAAFVEHDISAVVWANHVLRSSITAMQQTAAEIFAAQSLVTVEDKIATVSEVFRLQGTDELSEAESRYLPATKTKQVKAVILANVKGEEMGDLTADRPKAMVEVGGKPILQHIANTYRKAGITDINVIQGYRSENLRLEGATFFDSPTHHRREEVLAISSVVEHLDGPAIISYGDVLFRKFIPRVLADSDADFAVMIDLNWQTSRNHDRYADYAVCKQDPAAQAFYEPIHLKRITTDIHEQQIHGEWMGFLKTSAAGSQVVAKLVKEILSSPKEVIAQADMGYLINRLLDDGHEIKVFTTSGNWIDCDSVADALEGSDFS